MGDPSDPSTRAAAQGEARPSGLRGGERKSLRPGGPESLVGVVLSGRYLIEKLIGEGGMGAVYRAEHTHMRKRLAVKVLHPEMSRLPEVVARFEREAMAAAHIDHPNVAAATDFGKLDDGSFFLVLEFIEGRSLREAIAGAPLELSSALHITRQIASALGRAHALGIVHRDLKPENVMLVVRDGDPNFVKVLDFGIAKVPVGELVGEARGASGQVLTQLGMVYGTPEYMAPEQALGQPVDGRADLYALGAIVFEMLTGVRPYNHESKVTLLGMHVTAPIPRMSERAPAADIPPELDAIVTKLLAKEASARFADARELIETLDQTGALLAARGRIAEPLPPQSSHSTRASSPRFSAVDAAADPTAIGPNRLAAPAVGDIRALAARALSRFEPILSRWPEWARHRALLAGAAGLLVVGLIAAAVAHGSATVGASSRIATAEPLKLAAPRADPKVNETIALAMSNIEKGDFATAIDQLSAIEKLSPDRADVHLGLEKAYTGARNGREAMREAGAWLAADPTSAADLKLQEDVRNAALLRDTQEQALDLLEAKMGARGIDILYDIAYGTSGRLYPQAAARAKRSLATDSVRGRASPALAVLLDLRDAKSCEARHALLDRMRDEGDARSLPLLQQYGQTRGCGFLGAADCYPCMHRDELLTDAINAIQQRTVKTP
ncbi:MAG TPA: serine/threonine-protein kinase [Polyangiaceae bacterium]|nr:serine/threonine-protein kinase [Polyangiaceae bacterium]